MRRCGRRFAATIRHPGARAGRSAPGITGPAIAAQQPQRCRQAALASRPGSMLILCPIPGDCRAAPVRCAGGSPGLRAVVQVSARYPELTTLMSIPAIEIAPFDPQTAGEVEFGARNAFRNRFERESGRRIRPTAWRNASATCATPLPSRTPSAGSHGERGAPRLWRAGPSTSTADRTTGTAPRSISASCRSGGGEAWGVRCWVRLPRWRSARSAGC